MKKVLGMSALALGAALAACGDDDGSGALTFTTWGEDYVEREIPADDVEDGWTIRFDRFLLAIGAVTVAEPGAPPAARMTASKIFAMTAPGAKEVVRFPDLPARAYPEVSFEVAPVTADTELGEGATDADRDAMVAGGWSVYVEATATRGEVTKRLRWGFGTRTRYERCRSNAAGKPTDGVVVTNGGVEVVELTIHGDHFFYDDLAAPDAKVRFDALADADADADGEIALEELAAVELAAIPAARGPYGTGNAAGVHDLRGFVEALSRTVGHFRGEGECVSVAVP